MRVLYLTWGETPRSYGVFGSQVIGQFTENAKFMSDAQFYFASAVPIVHSGLVREKWSYLNEIKNVRNHLGSIPFFWLPIYAPQNMMNSNTFSFKWMHIGAHQHLVQLVKRIQPNVIHCRSYHASWAALCVKNKYNLNYKIIFDARGLWPEEVTLKNGYSFNGKGYNFLKKIESDLLQQCDLTIAVSDPMQAHYESLGVKQVNTIYLSADVTQLAYEHVATNSNNQRLQFCYVGALSDNTWHHPTTLKNLFIHIRERIPDAQLTIVTTSNYEALKQIFVEFSKDVSFTSVKTSSELKVVLKKMDFGLLSYRKITNKYEEFLGMSMLATKTAEYLVAGLPMIINKFCGGAASIVEKNNMGLTYDPATYEGLSAVKLKCFNTPEQRRRISLKAIELFSYQAHANEYVDIYKTLKN